MRPSKPWSVAFVALAAAACVHTDANQTTAPLVIALASTTPPLVADAGGDEGALYLVQTPVRLPIRRPTGAEEAKLGEQAPYPRAPFLQAGDVRLEVRWTLTNVDDVKREVELLLDPWNEFARWLPGLTQGGEEETFPNFSGYQRAVVLQPRERVEGVITEADLREMAVDLATAMTIAQASPAGAGALMNHAMNPQNRSSAPSPLIAPYLPAVTAGLVGFDLGLRARAASNVALEVTVDMVDAKGDRLVGADSRKPTFDAPGQTLTPPPPAP